MVNMKKLTNQFKNQIEAKIVELEKLTSVEFVPAYKERSSDYRSWKLLSGLFVFSLVLSISVYRDWPASGELKIFMSFLAGVLVAALLCWDLALRILLPRAVKLREVEDAAQRIFLTEEIFETKDRTGVLIFISEFEKAVYILADKGLLKKVPAQEWQALGVTLANDFSKQSAGDTFFQSLDVLSKRLSPEFPPSLENLNELKNQIRE